MGGGSKLLGRLFLNLRCFESAERPLPGITPFAS